jgi:hypothetical protein
VWREDVAGCLVPRPWLRMAGVRPGPETTSKLWF